MDKESRVALSTLLSEGRLPFSVNVHPSQSEVVSHHQTIPSTLPRSFSVVSKGRFIRILLLLGEEAILGNSQVDCLFEPFTPLSSLPLDGNN